MKCIYIKLCNKCGVSCQANIILTRFWGFPMFFLWFSPNKQKRIIKMTRGWFLNETYITGLWIFSRKIMSGLNISIWNIKLFFVLNFYWIWTMKKVFGCWFSKISFDALWKGVIFQYRVTLHVLFALLLFDLFIYTGDYSNAI